MALSQSELPTLKQLEYAAAVADEGNFGRAADRCFISQPTLSAQIRELEQRLGMELFERGRHGARVAPEAAPVISQIKQVLVHMQNLLETVAAQEGEIKGTLRLGVIPTMAPYLLPVVVSELTKRQPMAQLELAEMQTEVLIAGLLAGTVDIGLLAAGYAPTLHERFLLFEPFYLVSHSTGEFAQGGAVSNEELAEIPLLLLEDGHCLRDQALAICAASGNTNSHEVHGVSLSTLVQMVAAGRGVTLLPKSALGIEIRPDSDLCVRPLQDQKAGRDVALVWRSESPRSKYYETLSQGLQQTLNV